MLTKKKKERSETYLPPIFISSKNMYVFIWNALNITTLARFDLSGWTGMQPAVIIRSSSLSSLLLAQFLILCMYI